ncbi:acyl-CoA dehydrogenase family protein [Acuticoccus yangtzensis]|uniref:acyl-CoA dehydrogenase family protein n=1 Tax=Acuticoccus yangtzensis TaxID=1443441 RepID=UPI0009FAC3D1|nr:acyl-CoA dehydrogenase family protein [Acuticoccus yangtzensis]
MLEAAAHAAPDDDLAPFADGLSAIRANAAAADGAGHTLAADVAELRRAGLLVAPLPVQAGGSGLGTGHRHTNAAVTLLRALGRANLSVARLFEGHVNAVKLLALYADPGVRAEVFDRVRRGLLLGVWGADGASPVVFDGDGLTGSKRFASGLGLVGAALVTAKRQAGTQLCLVPADDVDRQDPGAWTASGMRATASGTYRLDGLRGADVVPVGEPDALFREPHFEGGVWRYCAAHLGGAEALYAEMLNHLGDRGQLDAPLQQLRVADAAVACEGARLWIEAAAERVERADPRSGENAAAYALLARQATEAACSCVIHAVEQAVGTAAFMEGTAIERIRRDLGLYIRQAAPDAKRARAVRALAVCHARADEL